MREGPGAFTRATPLHTLPASDLSTIRSMQTKRVDFPRVMFPRAVIEEVAATLLAAANDRPSNAPEEVIEDEVTTVRYLSMMVRLSNIEWRFDDPEEFLAAVDAEHDSYSCIFQVGKDYDQEVTIHKFAHMTSVSVSMPTRGLVERVAAPFHRAAVQWFVPEPVEEVIPAPKPVVFIGHGGSPLWREVKDHLADLHGYEVVAYETGARVGHAIRDVLDTMLLKSSFAILVMTAEDEQADETIRARQNVVHEAGLFQGRLGFPRVAILCEEGVDLFSNVAGIQYIPFSRRNIRETFGDVLATLRREFHTER